MLLMHSQHPYVMQCMHLRMRSEVQDKLFSIIIRDWWQPFVKLRQPKLIGREQTVRSKRRGFLVLWLILLVVVVGVAALVAVGILDLGRIKNSAPGESTAIVKDQQLENLQKVSTSDEVVDIEMDLDNTDLNNLDQELSEVDQALSQ